jgi:hypothetical protein
VYETQLDEALTERRYEVVGHQIVRLTNQVPKIVASVFFDLARDRTRGTTQSGAQYLPRLK